MDLVMALAVAVGISAADLPSLELRALARQVALPAGAADQWDAIGTFTIKGRNAPTTVKLYYADSDSIADKAERRGGFGIRTYPNAFSIHAVYREGHGPWKHEELYRAGRVGFWKVAEVKPEAISIQVRSKAIIFAHHTIRLTDEDLKRIFEPVLMQLTVKDGVPSVTETRVRR